VAQNTFLYLQFTSSKYMSILQNSKTEPSSNSNILIQEKIYLSPFELPVPSFFYPSGCQPESLPVGFQRPPSSLQAQAGNTGAADWSTTTSGGGGGAVSDRRRLDEEAYREEASWRARTPTWESRISDQERGGFDLFC
jgi:hypothetical protein